MLLRQILCFWGIQTFFLWCVWILASRTLRIRRHISSLPLPYSFYPTPVDSNLGLVIFLRRFQLFPGLLSFVSI